MLAVFLGFSAIEKRREKRDVTLEPVRTPGCAPLDIRL